MRERDVVDDDVRTAKQSLRRCLETRHVTSLGQQGGGRRVFWGAVSILDLSEFFFRTMSNTFLGEKKFPGGFAPLVETLLETLTIINRNELQPFKSISNATAYYDGGESTARSFSGSRITRRHWWRVLITVDARGGWRRKSCRRVRSVRRQAPLGAKNRTSVSTELLVASSTLQGRGERTSTRGYKIPRAPPRATVCAHALAWRR